MAIPMPSPEQLQYHPLLFDSQEQSLLMNALQEEIPWKQEQIKLFGKTHPTPRLTAWHGDTHCVYKYSGVVNQPFPWTPSLLTIKTRASISLSDTFIDAKQVQKEYHLFKQISI